MVDLDRVMTVEKSIVASWERTPGTVHDADARAFSLALSRKRSRIAFPDDFTALVRPLQERLIKKHDRNSVEGESLRALRQIRVSATPSWEGDQVALFFSFIREDGGPPVEASQFSSLLRSWLALVPSKDRFCKIDGAITSLSELTAAEYLDSDPLDLDHLSFVGDGEA